jgi:hypothetical protein
VLADADVVIHYVVTKAAASSKDIEMQLFLENRGAMSLDMKNVTVRYWLTAEAPTPKLTSFYQGDDLKNSIALAFVSGDEDYVVASFSGGVIPPAEPLYKTEFQIQIESATVDFEQTNDWSFDASSTSNAPSRPNPKITAYLGTELVWGCEPSGVCAGAAGEGGAGGQGQGGEPAQAGQGGEAEQGGQAGQGSGGEISAGQGGDTSGGGQAGI